MAAILALKTILAKKPEKVFTIRETSSSKLELIVPCIID